MLDTQLALLENAQLVRPMEEAELAYFFKHALTQEATYESLLLKNRREIHRRVAETIEQLYADQLDEQAGLLAHHYAQAGDDARTLEYATRAGDTAARVYANAEALAYYTQGLQIAKRSLDTDAQLQKLYARRGRVLELIGEYAQALANYEDMEHLAQTRPAPAMQLAAQMARATILSTPNRQFDPTAARDLSERSLALARELNDRAAQAKILWNLMLLSHFTGRWQDAIEYGEQSVAIARELELREQLAYSLNDISRAYRMRGDLEQAQAVLDEAQAIWRDLNNMPMLADNLNAAATMASSTGDYDAALALATEAYHIGETINNGWTQAHSLMTISMIHADRGQIAQALHSLHECLRLAQQVGFRVALAVAQTTLALTYAEMGDLAPAFQVIRPAALNTERPDQWEASAQSVLAHIYLLQGDLDQARELIRQTYAASEHVPPTPFPIGSALLADVELALREHNFARAVTAADNFLKVTSQSGVYFLGLYASWLKGYALFREGRIQEAEEILEDARSKAERVGARRTLWRILATLGDIAVQRGNLAEANAFREQAREMIQFIAEHAPPDLRASFLDLPDVRGIMEPVTT